MNSKYAPYESFIFENMYCKYGSCLRRCYLLSTQDFSRFFFDSFNLLYDVNLEYILSCQAHSSYIKFILFFCSSHINHFYHSYFTDAGQDVCSLLYSTAQVSWHVTCQIFCMEIYCFVYFIMIY